LAYDKERQLFLLTIETVTIPAGSRAPSSPFGEVYVYQGAKISTRSSIYTMHSPKDKGPAIRSSEDQFSGPNYHCYQDTLYLEEFPVEIYIENTYSWNQGIDMRGTAGPEGIRFKPIP